MKFNASYFIGGLDCLNLCNTFDHQHQPPQYDFLTDRESAVEWGKAAGILGSESRPSSGGGRTSLAALRTSRALLYRVLSPFARAARPNTRDLADLSESLRQASTALRLTPVRGGYDLAPQSRDPLEQVTIAAIRSAADYLVSPDRPPLRSCPGCGWLFLDTSRNRMRRWCVMKICGNRAKAHRHYERSRRKKGGAPAG